MNNTTPIYRRIERPPRSIRAATRLHARRRCLGRRLAGFMSQLRERKVCRAAAVYAIMSWVILQLGEIVFPALALPDWTLTLVVLVAVGFFPVAMVLAWVLQWTDDGLVVDVPVSGDGDQRSRFETALNIVLLLAAVTLAAELVWENAMALNGGADTVASDSVYKTIAIIPFTVDAHDDMNVHAVEQLLRHELVSSRDSALQLVAGVSHEQAFGADGLSLDWLVEGSVYTVDGQVRLVLQLIELPQRRYVKSWTLTVDQETGVPEKLAKTAAATVIRHLDELEKH